MKIVSIIRQSVSRVKLTIAYIYHALVLRDSNESAIFQKFRQTESSVPMYILMYLCVVAFCVYRGWSQLAHHPNVFGFVTAAFSGILLLVGLLLIFLYLPRLTRKYVSERSSWQKIISRIETIWVVGTNFVLDLMIANIIYNGVCEHEKDFGCNRMADFMPEGMVLVSMMIPSILAMIVKGVDFKWIFFAWTVNTAVMIALMLSYGLTSSYMSLLCFIPLSLIAVCENQRQILSIYYLTQAQQNLLEENKRVAAENHTTEMRHMIGNVAHDLKTPLTAFLSGVELITTVLSEISMCDTITSATDNSNNNNSKIMNSSNRINEGVLSRQNSSIDAQVREKISVIRDSIDNMRNVNAFMLMSINRCIDFTKSTNGLKLVPRLETVNLSETINLPLSCMKELQTRTTISLNAISSKVCANVITDKQWLQENILCLLSNAVKYSQQGAVKINITLLTKDGSGNYRAAEDHFESIPTTQHQFQRSQKYQQHQQQINSLVSTPPTVVSPKMNRNGTSTSLASTAPSSTYAHESGKRRIKPESATHLHKVVPLNSLRVRSTDSSQDDSTQYHDFVVVLKPSSTDTDDDLGLVMETLHSGKSSLSVEAEVLEPMIKVEVEDSGIGVSDGVITGLFKPFIQAQRLAGGTGLGLYSLAKRVEALGGKYGVEKRSDGMQGSVFWFTFPYRPDHTIEDRRNRRGSMKSNKNNCAVSVGRRLVSTVSSSIAEDRDDEVEVISLSVKHAQEHPDQQYQQISGEINRNKSKQENTNVAGATNNTAVLTDASETLEMHRGGAQKDVSEGLHVLLVDDSFTILKMTTSMLVRKGHSVRTAENGVEAVEMVAAERARSSGGVFDVVLMDLQMPIMDGLEATRRIRASETPITLGSRAAISSEMSREPSLHSMVSEGASESASQYEIVAITGQASTPKSFVKRVRSHSVLSPGNSERFSSGSPAKLSKKRTVRGSPANPRLGANCMAHQFIIGVSANSDHETVKAAFLAGVDAFIPKPFTLQTFVDTYNEYCESLLEEDSSEG